MRNFGDFGLDLYIKGERDSFIVLPKYSLTVYSSVGTYVNMENMSNSIEYFNINNSTFRANRCVLYYYNESQQKFIEVSTVNHTNTVIPQIPPR